MINPAQHAINDIWDRHSDYWIKTFQKWLALAQDTQIGQVFIDPIDGDSDICVLKSVTGDNTGITFQYALDQFTGTLNISRNRFEAIEFWSPTLAQFSAEGEPGVVFFEMCHTTPAAETIHAIPLIWLFEGEPDYTDDDLVDACDGWHGIRHADACGSVYDSDYLELPCHLNPATLRDELPWCWVTRIEDLPRQTAESVNTAIEELAGEIPHGVLPLVFAEVDDIDRWHGVVFASLTYAETAHFQIKAHLHGIVLNPKIKHDGIPEMLAAMTGWLLSDLSQFHLVENEIARGARTFEIISQHADHPNLTSFTNHSFANGFAYLWPPAEWEEDGDDMPIFHQYTIKKDPLIVS